MLDCWFQKVRETVGHQQQRLLMHFHVPRQSPYKTLNVLMLSHSHVFNVTEQIRPALCEHRLRRRL